MHQKPFHNQRPPVHLPHLRLLLQFLQPDVFISIITAARFAPLLNQRKHLFKRGLSQKIFFCRFLFRLKICDQLLRHLPPVLLLVKKLPAPCRFYLLHPLQQTLIIRKLQLFCRFFYRFRIFLHHVLPDALFPRPQTPLHPPFLLDGHLFDQKPDMPVKPVPVRRIPADREETVPSHLISASSGFRCHCCRQPEKCSECLFLFQCKIRAACQQRQHVFRTFHSLKNCQNFRRKRSVHIRFPDIVPKHRQLRLR